MAAAADRTTAWRRACVLGALFAASCGGPAGSREADDDGAVSDAPAEHASDTAEAGRDAEAGDDEVAPDAPGEDAEGESDDADGADADSGGDAGDDGGPGPDDAVETADDGGADDAFAGWRSALHPEDWTPEFEGPGGEFLHDFSYAGYHNGETPLGVDPPSAVFDVVAGFGADGTGATDATAAVQEAIDAAAAAGGGVVLFPAGLYRFDGVLIVSASRTVLRGEGPDLSRLYFTRSADMSYRSHITFRAALAGDLEIPLAADGEAKLFAFEVADAGDLAVGDDVAIGWVITPEFIDEHGMTGTWQAFNDTWQPFFRRDVVEIDRSASPQRVVVDVPTRYPPRVRDRASVRRERGALRECGVESLGLSNAVEWAAAWEQNQVHVLELDGVIDCWVRDVGSFASPAGPASGLGVGTHLQSGGIIVRNAKRVTVADTSLSLAENRGSGGNGYVFEVRQSSEVLFRDCTARAGRHNFIQNWGFGVTGCVWLRVRSSEGRAIEFRDIPIGLVAYSEYHHSLATANLVDSVVLDDGWSAVNRGTESTGAGHTATQCVVWNAGGTGRVQSFQYGLGYVIGTGPGNDVRIAGGGAAAAGTEPTDWLEGEGEGATLVPQSLYEDQLRRRLGP
jgi:hypothetical protein